MKQTSVTAQPHPVPPASRSQHPASPSQPKPNKAPKGTSLRLNAFPIDRHAFTFRPIELLGVALGASLTSSLPEADKRWLREVLNEAPKKCATDHWSNHLIS